MKMCIWCREEEREQGSLYCGPACKQLASEYKGGPTCNDATDE